MKLKDYIDAISAIAAAIAAMLAIIALAAMAAMAIVAFTEHYFQKKEQQDGRVQDIIIHGKLYNCEEAKNK